MERESTNKGDNMVRSNRITIKDVAKKAGVSPSTVSRVISGSQRISEETTIHVNKCMEEMGYFPNAIARSLANKYTNTIGLIMPNKPGEALLNPFFPQAISGIIKGATIYGYDVLISSHLEGDDEIKSISSLVNASKVDGILLMTSRLEDKSIEYLTKVGFPFAVIGSPSDKYQFNCVDNDNISASYELTTYLINEGYKSFALIAGDETLTVTDHRIKGYLKALEDGKIPLSNSSLYSGDFNERTGHYFGNLLGEEGKLPEAIIVTDDVVAYGLASAFNENGIRVPGDVAIASFNNSLLSRQCHIPLTSVEINADMLGEEATKILVNSIKNDDDYKKVTVPYKIHIRESTMRTLL